MHFQLLIELMRLSPEGLVLNAGALSVVNLEILLPQSLIFLLEIVHFFEFSIDSLYGGVNLIIDREVKVGFDDLEGAKLFRAAVSSLEDPFPFM